MAYVYIKSEPNLWTVGHYDPSGNWIPESDHDSTEEATKKVAWLNGGHLPGGIDFHPTPQPEQYSTPKGEENKHHYLIDGVKCPISFDEKEVYHFGQWKKIQEDAGGQKYIMGGLGSIFLKAPTVQEPAPSHIQEGKHTPGEWKVVNQGKLPEGEGDLICIRSEVSNGYIAQVQNNIGEHRKEAEANARLIASAPQLKAENERLVAANEQWANVCRSDRQEVHKLQTANKELREALRHLLNAETFEQVTAAKEQAAKLTK